MKTIFDAYREEINKSLEEYLASDNSELFSVMRYSILNGGKRIRPIITLAFCSLCGGDIKKALPFAAAIEMVHTYSLIFDDLPSMDNDDYRRGKLSTHKVYGEAMAMLGALGLYAEAVKLTATAPVKKETALSAVKLLSEASGLDGILPGQALDIKNEGTSLSYDEVLNIHKLKTSAMLEAAAVLGCMAAEADSEKIALAREYAVNIGLAFQIRDDILDVIGSREKMGKTLGKDKIEEKTTFVDIFGVDKAQEYVTEYTKKAKAVISDFENNEFLVWLADLLSERDS